MGRNWRVLNLYKFMTKSEYKIDAKNKPLGRLASEIAVILQGKKTADYAQNKVADVQVLVKNVGSLAITGNKAKKKIYYRHTGYVGHLKEKTFEQLFAKSPEKVLREAVRNMLPKNFLNQRRLKNIIFVEE